MGDVIRYIFNKKGAQFCNKVWPNMKEKHGNAALLTQLFLVFCSLNRTLQDILKIYSRNIQTIVRSRNGKSKPCAH